MGRCFSIWLNNNKIFIIAPLWTQSIKIAFTSNREAFIESLQPTFLAAIFNQIIQKKKI